MDRKKARLMIWKNKLDVWYLTLWIPFYGQWNLAVHMKKPVFDRKAKGIIASLGIPVEEVDRVPDRG